ncbi:alpha/beta fold hydrolase [Corynebacterium otitidis]|uniref:Prolyl aminopeptidase 2 n=1 Tax=Corynebacterium otitidis ATCC 51513 TaxID=883169 RepID=I7L8V8_9CORY|nr:alpha/beta fold hydrolase [Corynebacterium otitidis]EJZ82217.1 hypothetical protein HMPREF9719_00832 [Corynebacterium otitidis ATCC 51513]CCI83417.1 prolyl aminopeptidase 2 [Corynebacterium otitidis ATCC 51513]
MSTETTWLGPYRIDDHTITVPLSTDPGDEHEIDVFARVITPPGGEDLEHLLFLQGGPGNEAPRVPADWFPTALERHRLVLLDQRGTGRSTPLGVSPAGEVPEAEYLSHFRADGIVRDAEALREHLGVKRWSVLGQSFGGFTLLHYAQAAPGSISRAYFTGGLPSVTRGVEEIYRETYGELRRHSERFYRAFPKLRPVVRDLEARAAERTIVLPDGEAVSPSRLKSLGHLLGTNDGWQQLAALLDLGPKHPAFAHDLAGLLPFDGRNPLYYVLHESSYANGEATNWAAERALPEEFVKDSSLFTGEHVFSEWADTVPAFRPWREAAAELAGWEWPTLWEPEALAESGMKGAAAIYATDAFVPLRFSLETADLLPGVERLVTSEHEHNGLRASGGKVLRHLFELADGTRAR